ncbi:Rieske (2Fe-2S) protein [Actinomycetes bacterium KLBMP 9759]
MHALSRRCFATCAVVAGPLVAGCAAYDQRAAPAVSAAAPDGPPIVLGLATTIPVGGGTIFTEQGIVVTQPVAGTFRGFSAECTHQGCAVTTVADGTINCPCHGSSFAVADGAPVAGPADRPLATRPVRLTGEGQIVL